MSANLMDLLQGSLSEGMIDQLSQQLGGANKQQTAAAASGIVTTLIGRNNGNISNLKFTSRSSDFFDMQIDVEVRDNRHLTNIIAALRASPSISSVERARA